MAKFTYNLESILNIKIEMQDQKKNEYRKATKELENLIDIKKKL